MSASDKLLFETSRLRLLGLQAGDEERLQAVFSAAGDYFLTVTGRPEADPDAAAREIAATSSIPGRRIGLLELREEGEPAGAIGWWQGHPEPDIALLGMLVVVPTLRGRGLAREALGGLERWLRDQEIRRVRTGVGAGDTQKHALLAALGFEPLDERRHVSLDRGRVMIALFEKPVA